jgi:hypothetical protein
MKTWHRGGSEKTGRAGYSASSEVLCCFERLAEGKSITLEVSQFGQILLLRAHNIIASGKE